MNYTATLTSKGQITIPKAIRDFFDLGARDSLVFTISKNKVIAEPVKSDILKYAGKYYKQARAKKIKVDKIRDMIDYSGL